MDAVVADLRGIAAQAGVAVGDDSQSHQKDASVNKSASFSLRRYLPFAQRLLSRIGPEWLSLFSEKDRSEAFDAFFDAKQCPQVKQNRYFLF